MKNSLGWWGIPYGIVIGLIAGAVIFLVTRQPAGKPITLAPTSSPAPILVHVDGAVNQPGVVSLDPGSRVQDTIQAVGGLSPDADTSKLNLAALLVDGQKIYVPRQGEAVTTSDQSSSAIGELVDLNTASLEMLMTLPGIGEDRAKAIIAYREKVGGFKIIEEIQNIEGIGPATYEKLKALIIVSPVP